MKNRSSFLLVILSAVFCVALVVSNIVAGKLWQAPFGIVLTCGVFMFPIVYILDDVLPEVYGYVVARKIIFLGFACNLMVVLFFLLTLKASFPPYFVNQDAFVAVLGFTPRLLLASFVAYLIGTNLNAWILTVIKRWTNGRFLWMRTIGSTIVGESVDSTIFILLAFYGILPSGVLPLMIVSQAVFKTLYEVLATPLTYLVIGYVKRRELSE